MTCDISAEGHLIRKALVRAPVGEPRETKFSRLAPAESSVFRAGFVAVRLLYGAQRPSRLHPRDADMPLTGDSPCNATRPYQRPGAPRPWRRCSCACPPSAYDRPGTLDPPSGHGGAQVPEPDAPRPARSRVEELRPRQTERGATRSSRTEDTPRNSPSSVSWFIAAALSMSAA